MTVTILEAELYAISDAAELLRVPTSTLRWWLEGRDDHPPVIRDAPTGSAHVTWGEFIEAGFVRAYRRRDIPLQQVRDFIRCLRKDFGIPYPLAHEKPFIGEGRRLLMRAQTAAGLDDQPVVFQTLSGQLLLDGHIEDWVERIDFSSQGPSWAERYFPAGRESPVVIDPDFSFGAPTVRGIRTEALVELLDAGEAVEDVAATYDLDVAVVKAAAAYEWNAAAPIRERAA